MKTVDILSPGADTAGTADLPDEVFDAQANVPLMHQVVVAQQAAARQGTHATKTRGMVRGGGKKPYRQKGTGRARQGSMRAPHYVGGGTVHGPQPRSYQQRTPKKMKAAALRGALSERARHDRVHVVSGFAGSDLPSTKDAVALLSSVTGTRRGIGALVVLHSGDEVGWLSLRNAPGVHVLREDQLNTYDVLASDHVVFTEQALAAFLERTGKLGRTGKKDKEAQA
jgi:large subunit ribosomal protein L4